MSLQTEHPSKFFARILILAIAPSATIALLLTVVSVVNRFGDLESSLEQRALANARRLAQVAELPIYAGDREALIEVARQAVSDEDLLSVSVLAPDGEVLAEEMKRFSSAHQANESLARAMVVRAPIEPGTGPIDPSFVQAFGSGESPSSTKPSGHEIRLRYSTRTVERQKKQLLWASLGITCVVLTITGLLAARFAREVSNSIDSLTEDLRGQRQRAENADLAKTRLLAMASHDLRQPICALSLLVAQLKGLQHPDRVKALLDHVGHSVLAVNELLDALLELSKLDAGATKMDLQPVDIGKLFRNIELEFGETARNQGLCFRVVPCRHFGLSDPKLLARVLRNLVANAVAYTPEGAVMLTCRQRGDCLRIEVRDSGIGIPESALGRIFNEYVQLEQTPKEPNKGLGLGLAIVDRLTQLLGHRRDVRSRVGVGSTFAVEIPRVISAVNPCAKDHEPLPSTPAINKTVMVIDDDPAVRNALGLLLQSWGCTVISCPSADAALNQATQETNLDLILSDYHLGTGRSGIEVVHAIRKKLERNVPATIITGNTHAQVFDETRTAQLVLLHKPIAPDALYDYLKSNLCAQGQKETAREALSLIRL